MRGRSLDDLAGKRISNVCADCASVTVIDPPIGDAGDRVYLATVYHDETCPGLRAVRKREEQRHA